MASQLNVIPYPDTVDYVGPELYVLPETPSIQCDVANESLLHNAKYLQQSLDQRFNTPSIVSGPVNDQHATDRPGRAITLLVVEQLQQLDQFRWKQEGYQLECGHHGITITALTAVGVFYGIQTLLQALQATSDGLVLPYTMVVDAPRFIWRGVLLDVGRHFFPVDFIKKVLDLMALYKMNRFHWHLTEDQGWRLEVPSLPRLSEVAAYRGTPPTVVPLPNDTTTSTNSNSSSDDTSASQRENSGSDQQQQQDLRRSDEQQFQQCTPPPAAAAAAAAASICGRAVPTAAAYHGGYYSMADVAAVVSYAAERCIEVVPEIELPGHCVAALAAYPHLSCSGDVTAVSTQWGIHEDVYCAGNDDVFSFLERVFDQVVAQFPCQYIHIGGDEVPKVRWEECDKCQDRMRKEGLTTEAELQSWFVQRISQMLAAKGRKLIGWDEILEGGLAEGATVMSWRGNVGGIIAAKSGHDVIMTPTSYCYFDYRQAPNPCEPGAWYACLPLNVVYQYDPIPAQWPDAAAAVACEETSEGADMQLESGSGDGTTSSMSHSQQQQQQQLQQQRAGSAAEEGDEAQSPAAAAAPVAAAAATGLGGGSINTGEDTVMNEPDSRPSAAQPFSLVQQQHGSSAQPALSPVLQTAGAAVDTAAAATAAGPHFPGSPPGVSLAAMLPAAAAAAHGSTAPAAAEAPASSTVGSSSSSTMLSADEAAHILGSQANLWCEYVQDQDTAEYMLLPRLAALAESVWTPVSVKDWSRFSSRLNDHLPLLQKLGYKYRPLS